jgi:uncharacterized protein (DUF1684 family)
LEPFAYDRAAHEASVRAWRRGRLARLTAPDGWLSLVSRVPLDEGTTRVGSAPDSGVALPADRAPPEVGSFRREGATVTFTPAPGVAISSQGRAGLVALRPGVTVGVATDRDGPADRLALGALTMEVVERPDGMFVRVRDPENPARRDFAGIDHFLIAPRWRVVATLERYEPPRPIDLGYETGSVERYYSPGAAAFQVDGVSCRVDPVFDGDRGRLYLVFWDPTARDSTYGAGRFLYAPLPDGDRVLLDFNQAFSPPCAFTPYAACPLAPAQNRLSIRVEAGEKSPHGSGAPPIAG